ncbi:hypothetical protein BJV74DRAFT_766972 [Russula compacta]|nr:hypothetical protein BJV74DRAFT_766972 [Russula compacta]
MQVQEETSKSVPRTSEHLSSYEIVWRDRQPFLESKGYMLRPRLRPGWTPSWLTTRKPRRFCEDFARLPLRPFLVDATRISDGKLVYIKEVKTGDQESRIASMLSALDDPANHSVPILDTFLDHADDTISYIVMPFLRLSDSPPFETVWEVMDFVDQVLEGLAFIHSHGVAHRRDCSLKNILMDGLHMFPLGFHPVKDILLHDISTPAPIIPRRDAGVKYYFVDYGISSYFPAGSQSHLVLGLDGRDQDVPELSDTVPYDPFKVDIYTIGNVLRGEFCNNHPNLDFLRPLTVSMTWSDPNRRPSAEEVLRQWRTLRGNVGFVRRHWRLRDKEEPFMYGLVLDIIYVLWSIPRLIGLTTRRLS